MFGLTPYRGRRNLERGLTNFDDVVDYFFNGVDYRFNSNFSMNVDIKDEGDKYLLEAELPGVNKENINVEVRDGVLTISIENKEEVNEEKDNYVRKERRYGAFRRSFAVDDIEQDKIDAKFENGVLYLELPKSKETKSNRIEIK